MSDLLNAAPCGVLLFDDGGKILSANATLERMLGYDSGSLSGQSIDAILSVASRIFYNTHFFPLVRLHSRADEIFLTLIDREGTDVPVLSNTVRTEREGRFQNIAVFMSVWQRKKFEEEILQAKRAAEEALTENTHLQQLARSLELHSEQLEKQNQRIRAINEDLVQFSKIITHDLQEPIRKIKLFASVIASTPDGNLSQRNMSALDRIETSAQRLSDLTRGLHEYLSIDPETTSEQVPLDVVFKSALEKVKIARGVDDFKVVKGNLPVLEGHPSQLELLFYHLLDNAIQFRRKDEPLVIKVEHTLLDENLYRSNKNKYKFVEHVRLIFSDNGSGFDDQYKHYVFDMAKKVHYGGKGLGFGLALIKKIVDAHNGTIRMESEHDRGTRAIVVLPLRRMFGDASTSPPF